MQDERLPKSALKYSQWENEVDIVQKEMERSLLGKELRNIGSISLVHKSS
jgi:hypothetical protein